MRYSTFLRCGCVLAGLLSSSVAAAAQTSGSIGGVIELFTSQGCSFCPPANRLLTKMAGKPDTIALTLPINYWDYIGWKDTLAAPEFTARQQGYAHDHGRGIYTPEAIIDGVFDTTGSDEEAIKKAIANGKSSGRVLNVPLHIYEAAGMLHIDIGSGTGSANVYVLRVEKSRTVQIARGANSGDRITYTNVVRAIHQVGEWKGAPMSLNLVELRADDEGYVVLLQRGSNASPGPILAAAKSAGL